ncbi:HTH domain-containing protein [Lactobacillus helveticus]|nr:HTH domain-containing protein [Lactobacillus helveticus]MBW8038056.1 HTH domain-containing protein [Lactobacillus helveticus]
MPPVQKVLNFNGLIFPNQESELTKLENKVVKLIPTGKENAKSCAYIAKTLKVSIRTVIETVRKLRLKHFDIGSTTNNGYYRFKDEQEYLEFMAKYSKEQSRRNNVLKAMQSTPMAKKIAVEDN